MWPNLTYFALYKPMFEVSQILSRSSYKQYKGQEVLLVLHFIV